MRRWRTVDTGGTLLCTTRYLFKTFFFIIHALPLLCICSTPRSSEGEQVIAPHGVRVRRMHPSSKGHLIRNRKTGPGWISYSRMGAFFPKISTYITSPEFIIFRWISACVPCCSFSYQVSIFNYIYLWIVDTTPCTYLM